MERARTPVNKNAHEEDLRTCPFLNCRLKQPHCEREESLSRVELDQEDFGRRRVYLQCGPNFVSHVHFRASFESSAMTRIYLIESFLNSSKAFSSASSPPTL